jgi:hypothetical protein
MHGQGLCTGLRKRDGTSAAKNFSPAETSALLPCD